MIKKRRVEMYRSDFTITVYSTEHDPEKDAEITQMHNAILELVRATLKKTKKYGFTWHNGVVLGALTNSMLEVHRKSVEGTLR